MKNIPAQLQSDIENGVIATFVKITRTDGLSLGFSDHDNIIIIDALAYNPTPGLNRLSMDQGVAAEVSNQEITGTYMLDLQESDLLSGVYDEAEIVVSKRSWVNPTIGQLIIFKGDLGMISWSDDGFKADVHSAMQDLSRVVGVTTTAKCRHQLFDQPADNRIGFCGINKGSFTYTDNVTSSTSKTKFVSNGLGAVNITNGVVTFTSGLNDGLAFEVKNYANPNVELFLPTPYVIQPGDTFSVVAGCDHTFDTCKGTYNNIINFGGFPDIRNETNFK